MHLNTDGLVIKETATGECDRVVTILTRDYGLVRAFVNGAKKIKSSFQCSTQLLSYSRFSIFKSRDAYIIDESQPIEVFIKLREDIARLALAQYFCELAGELSPESEPAEDFLRLFLNSLHLLSGGKRPQPLIKAVTELKLVSLAGYMPSLIACNDCGKFEDGTMYFDIRSGLLFCSECHKGGTPVGMGLVTAMRHIVFSEADRIFSFTLTDESLGALSIITENYLFEQVGKRFKTLDFYKQMI